MSRKLLPPACLPLLLSLVACSKGSAPNNDPSQNGSTSDAATDAVHDTMPETTEDVADTDKYIDAVEDLPADALDQDQDSSDACSVSTADPPDGSCEPGQQQRVWCGRCGKKRRLCSSGSVWGDWGSCIEDPDAECSACDSSLAPCGKCGTQPVWCDTSADRCRWVRGACQNEGICAAGSFRQDSVGCDDGMFPILWCISDCTWSEPASCQDQPQWAPIATPSIEARVDFFAVGPIIWGGTDPDKTTVFDNGARYDSNSNTWHPWPATDSSAPRLSGRRAAAVGAWNDNVFVFGGETANGQVLDDGAIGSSQHAWKFLSVENAPSPRSGATATVIATPTSGGLVVVYGGRSGHGPAAPSGAIYHFDADTWTELPPSPLGNRQEHSAVQEVIDGNPTDRIIFWGGRSGNGDTPLSSGAIYDATARSWLSMANAPIRRARHSAVWEPTTNCMFVLFGDDGFWPGYRGDGAIYDPIADTWSWLPDISAVGITPTDGTATIVGLDGVWVIAENLGARLDPRALTWASIPAPPDTSVFRRGWASLALSGSEEEIVVWGPLLGHAQRGYTQPALEAP